MQYNEERFKLYLERNKNPVTVEHYVRLTRFFFDWIASNGRKLDADSVDDYVLDLQAKGKSTKTINTYFYAVKAYFRSLRRGNELDDIPLPKGKRDEPRCIPEETVKKLMEKCTHFDDLIMVMLLYDTAPRVGELVMLTKDSFFPEERALEIRTLKQRVFPDPPPRDKVRLSEVTARLLADYIEKLDDSNPFLFPSRDSHITKVTVRNRLRRLCERAGVSYFNPHSFRHGMLDKLFEANIPLKQIQAFSRDRTLRALEMYFHRREDKMLDGGIIPDMMTGEDQEEDEYADIDKDFESTDQVREGKVRESEGSLKEKENGETD